MKANVGNGVIEIMHNRVNSGQKLVHRHWSCLGLYISIELPPRLRLESPVHALGGYVVGNIPRFGDLSELKILG